MGSGEKLTSSNHRVADVVSSNGEAMRSAQMIDEDIGIDEYLIHGSHSSREGTVSSGMEPKVDSSAASGSGCTDTKYASSASRMSCAIDLCSRSMSLSSCMRCAEVR